MGISESVKKALYMESAGYCQNPNCNCSLFPLFESGRVSNIVELAHIIGQKIDGPRGISNLNMVDRDLLDNILTLCPTCHTLIDKNEDEYPVEILHEWKKQHKMKIDSLFAVAEYDNKRELIKVIMPLFSENQYIFENYGPYSENALLSGYEAVNLWNKKVFEKVLPNNRKLVQYFKMNEKLFKPDDIFVLYKFYNHCEEFEYNKISGNKNSLAIKFPKEIYKILEE